MKTTYNWLKEFVDVSIPAKELADRLTMAGLEVVSLEERDGDFVFEIEITSNRPDWLSVTGLAREVAAITGKKLKQSPGRRRAKPSAITKTTFKVRIEDKNDCPLYTARIIRGVKVLSSPQWLRQRLEAVGCRSVNNIVDITNYVLFETGEPLHAFDADKLSGSLVNVRRAKAGEGIVTIDGAAKKLEMQNLVIADAQGVLAVAGVMGGRESEVSYSTVNILLEAAVFNPVVIRRSRQGLGLQSESSYRFERGVDAQMVVAASERAAELIVQISGGKSEAMICSGKAEGKRVSIALSEERLSRALGAQVPWPKAKGILQGLGFNLSARGKKALAVAVPSYRRDVKEEADLVEEVVRIYGYGRIPSSLLAVKSTPQVVSLRERISGIKSILVGLGLSEVITYSLLDKGLLSNFSAAQPLSILNPLSKEQEALRPLLAPSLCRCIAHNLNQQQEYVNIFEIANVYQDSPGENNRELLILGVALCGTRSYLGKQGKIQEEMGLLHLKGILEKVFKALGIKDYTFKAVGAGGNADILVSGEIAGSMQKVTRKALNVLDIKNKEIFALEISLKKLLAGADGNRKFIPLAKFPGVTRDISFLLKDGLGLQDLLQALAGAGGRLLKEVRIIDFYRGKQIPEGFRSLTISCFYQSDARTLTEEEVSPLNASLCALLRERFQAKLR